MWRARNIRAELNRYIRMSDATQMQLTIYFPCVHSSHVAWVSSQRRTYRHR